MTSLSRVEAITFDFFNTLIFHREGRGRGRILMEYLQASFLCGWEAALVPMLVMGCDGGTNALSGVVPEFMRSLYDLTVGGRIDEARALQYRLLELFDAIIYSADFPEGLRAAVELRGFNMGPSRQPLSDAQQVDRAELQQVLQCIISDFGYTAPPPEGCPPRDGDITRDRITQITEGVIAKLKQQGVVS